MKTETLEDLEAQIPELARKATRAAYEKALASGHPVVISDGENIIEIDKFGRKRILKRIGEGRAPSGKKRQ